MVGIGLALAVSLVVALFATPLFIRLLRRREYGQFIRKDGPTSHLTKRGTPTMGGVVIMAAALIGYAAASLYLHSLPSLSAWLFILIFVGPGLIGFLDDYIKISKQRSLGLRPGAKIIGQVAVGTVFALGCLLWPNHRGVTPGSAAISLIRDLPGLDFLRLGIAVGVVLMVVWVNFLVAAWSNGVNLTDGLDGLATGASLFAFGSYCAISIWQFYQRCPVLQPDAARACYQVRDPLDIAILAAAVVGACFGFLWWNTSPAQIFMGDTGSLALGGAFAGLTVLTHTEFLAVLIGGLFVVTVFSDIIQVGVFKLTHRRVFKMAPLHHHFELLGWPEVTIVVRFWIIAGLCAVLGVGLFYAEWVVHVS